MYSSAFPFRLEPVLKHALSTASKIFTNMNNKKSDAPYLLNPIKSGVLSIYFKACMPIVIQDLVFLKS